MFKTIDNEAEGIITEKKSKFIANIFYVENEKEAKKIKKKIKKKYYDARHNCYAYRIKNENGILQKQSDDGEPSGTAGSPMLNILEKKELINVIAIVTRYFGGILLGTGGLVKAYSEALKEALRNAEYAQIEQGYILEIITTYEDINKIEHLLIQNDVAIVNKEYTEKIKLLVEISKEKYEKIVKKIPENNLKKVKIEIKEEKNIKRKYNPQND